MSMIFIFSTPRNHICNGVLPALSMGANKLWVLTCFIFSLKQTTPIITRFNFDEKYL